MESSIARNIRTAALTLIALSVFAIALTELSGVSRSAFINRYMPAKSVAPLAITTVAQDTVQQQLAKMPKTKIIFTDTLFSFGKIKSGDSVQHAFTFRNSGDIPLLIGKVDASCGCTVASFSHEPVKPGQEGAVMVTFHSFGKSGTQHKYISVYANTENVVTKLAFTADVM